MAGIFAEWLACLAILGIALIGAYHCWVRFSWMGKRMQRELHKSVIETGAEIRCPVHGRFPLSEGIETVHGEVCPICYKEFVTIPTYTHLDHHHDDQQ